MKLNATCLKNFNVGHRAHFKDKLVVNLYLSFSVYLILRAIVIGIVLTWNQSPLDVQTLSSLLVQRFKDGAYYCYCAYVLRISRYSDFLSPMLTNTGIFFRGLKLSGESTS